MRLEQRIKQLIRRRQSIGLPLVGKQVINSRAHKLASYIRNRAARLDVQCDSCNRLARYSVKCKWTDSANETKNVFCSSNCEEKWYEGSLHYCSCCEEPLIHSSCSQTCEILEKCLCYECKNLPKYSVALRLLGGTEI